jgi:hypothetical protein
MQNNVKASGAYDKGTSAGKGIWEISFTLNPLNLVSYGQNYCVLSYGFTETFDLVSYYSIHKNGQKSFYFGGLYQFIDNRFIDLATALGFRKKYIDNYSTDLFTPQLLYNIKLPNHYTLGGSVVNVININDSKLVNAGVAIDLALYIPIKKINKINPRITEAYFGIGLFKNTGMNFSLNKLYLHYSIDFKFNFK